MSQYYHFFFDGGSPKPADLSSIIWRARSGVKSGTTNDINDIINPAKVTAANYVGNNCLSFDGTTGNYILDDDIVGTETVTSSDGTSTATVSAGRLDFTVGVMAYLELSNGIKYAFSTGSGANAWRVETKNTINFSETVVFSETIDMYS